MSVSDNRSWYCSFFLGPLTILSFVFKYFAIDFFAEVSNYVEVSLTRSWIIIGTSHCATEFLSLTLVIKIVLRNRLWSILQYSTILGLYDKFLRALFIWQYLKSIRTSFRCSELGGGWYHGLRFTRERLSSGYRAAREFYLGLEELPHVFLMPQDESCLDLQLPAEL